MKKVYFEIILLLFEKQELMLRNVLYQLEDEYVVHDRMVQFLLLMDLLIVLNQVLRLKNNNDQDFIYF